MSTYSLQQKTVMGSRVLKEGLCSFIFVFFKILAGERERESREECQREREKQAPY